MSKKSLFVSAVIALFIVLITCLVLVVSCSPKAPSRRGIILIISDTLRADHLGCYGYARQTSPQIDALAKEGALFTQAYSQCSWTKPSIASIFTSLYPSVHRAGHPKSRYGYSEYLYPSVTTLAEIMQQRGYRTYGVLNNGSISAKLGFDQGFEKYDNNEVVPADSPTQETYSKVIEYLDELKDDNFLLIWHIIDPHWPYYPPAKFKIFVDEAYNGRFQQGFITKHAAPLVNGSMGLSAAEIEHIISLYDGEIRYTDYQIRKLWAAIKQLGLEQQVSLIFTSDHGESFLEHGHFGHEFPMYEENLRVPLIIYDHRFAAQTIPDIVESIDIMPTILELASIPIPSGLQGKSLVPLLAGAKGGWTDKPAYSEGSQFIERKAIRTPQYKLIWGVTGLILNDNFISGQTEPPKFISQEKKLYDYSNAGGEKDVSQQLAEQVYTLTKQITAQMRINEQAQLASSSILKSFYFLDDWQESVYSTQGNIGWEDGVLSIVDDSQAQVIWKVALPRPMLRGQLQLIARCDKPIPFFALSPNLKSWTNLSLPNKAGQEFIKIGFDLTPLAGSQTLYFKLFQPSSAHTYLRGFYIHAQFSEKDMEVDEKTKQNLKTLGYLE